MKDMSRVIKGISMINKLNCDSKTVLLKLLVHETLRVYSDRLFTIDDKNLIEKIMNEELEMIFNVSLTELQNEVNPILFTHFFDIKRNYSLIPEHTEDEKWSSQLKSLLNDQLKKYNEE